MRRKPFPFDGLLLLLLLSVFALCILLVLLGGADAYKDLNQRDQQSYDRRTAIQYLTTRVRQADRLGGLRVEPFGEGDALVFLETIQGEDYETRIYCWEGQLRELFAARGSQLGPEDGTVVLPTAALEAQLTDGVLTLRLTAETGEVHRQTLTLRSREEVLLPP